MNARERLLLIILITIVGGGVGIYGVKRMWWDPFQETSRLIATITEENDTLEDQWNTFEQNRLKLPLARRKSLPLNPDQAGSEYQTFLRPLLKEVGLTEVAFQAATTSKTKLVSPITNVKEPGHLLLTVTVTAKGELDNLVKAMEKIYKAPYEHRIRSLTVDRTDTAMKKGSGSKLSVTMTMEALLVAKGDGKILTGDVDPKQLAMAMPEGRKYSDMPKKNVFIGYIPPPEKKKAPIVEVPDEPEETGPPRPDEDTPAYVRLTTTVPEQEVAYFRNLIYQTPEMKRAVKIPGFQEFQITDEFGNYIFFRAKLTKVEQRRVFIQIGRSNDGRFLSHNVYTLEIGQSLAEARNYSENRSRIDLIDDDLFDEDFFKSEKAKDEAATKKNTKKDNKGKTTKKGGGKMGG